MCLFTGSQNFAKEIITIMLEFNRSCEVFIHKGSSYIPTDAVLCMAKINTATPIFTTFDASTQLQHIPKHTYTSIQTDSPVLETGMISVTMDKSIILTINMRHDGLITVVILVAQSDIPFALTVIQTESRTVIRIRFQVRVTTFRLQRIGQLLYST